MSVSFDRNIKNENAFFSISPAATQPTQGKLVGIRICGSAHRTGKSCIIVGAVGGE
jgi:hypothetical protein